MNKKGFTLLELLVVIAVIGILTSILVLNYRAGARILAVERESLRFFQSVRKVQTYYLGKGEDGCKINGEFHDDYEYGYGLYFKNEPGNNASGEYIIFADCLGTKQYDDNDVVVETVNLESGVLINIDYLYGANPPGFCPSGWLKCDGEQPVPFTSQPCCAPGFPESNTGEFNPRSISLVFVLPDPFVYIHPGFFNSSEIRIETEDGGYYKILSVNELGLVEYDN